MEVDADQQRLVVEHLLEVGHEPFLVDRVAREATAEMVVDATTGHRVERRRDDDLCVFLWSPLIGAQHEIEAHRRRKLRRSAEATPHRIERTGELLHRLVELSHSRQAGRRFDLRRPTDRVAERLDVLLNLVLPVHPDVVDRSHEAQEVRLREVGAAVERMAVGREEDRHRPTTAAAHRLHRVHVDRVDVGPLLTVDLDVDEAAVHLGGDLVVLEAFVRHHVTPVAGGVADGQEDRHVSFRRRSERLGPPRVPIDRILSVLPQVRRGFCGESVRSCHAVHRTAAEAWLSLSAIGKSDRHGRNHPSPR